MMIPAVAAIVATHADGTVYWHYGEVEQVEPAKPPPEIPPLVWDSRPIDAEACAAATRAMCGG